MLCLNNSLGSRVDVQAFAIHEIATTLCAGCQDTQNIRNMKQCALTGRNTILRRRQQNHLLKKNKAKKKHTEIKDNADFE